MKLPILKAFSASFAYLTMHFGAVIKANWLAVLLLQIMLVLIMPRYMEPMMALQAVDAEANPADVFSMMGPAFFWVGILYLGMAVFYPMLIAANLRPIIRGETSALPFYLQFGMDELRVLLTFVLLIVLMIIVYTIGILAFMLVGMALSALSATLGGIVIALGAVVFFVAIIWFSLRMSLIFPATIDLKKIGVPYSWRVTKGNSWRLFAYWMLWALVFMVIVSIYMLFLLPGYFDVMKEVIAVGQDETARQAAAMKMNQMQLEMWDISKPGGWLNLAGNYVYTLITVALWNIAGGMAYRYLTEDASPA